MQADGQNVELQLRTTYQHYWATAVEMHDNAVDSQLKFGNTCHPGYQFFLRVSELIRLLETTELDQKGFYTLNHSKNDSIDHFDKIRSSSTGSAREAFATTLRVLEAASNEISFIGPEPTINPNNFYLAIFDKTIQTVEIKEVSLNKAVRKYMEEEQISENKDVVLVRGASLSELKKMYPNYFGDITSFIKLVTRLIETKGQMFI